MEVLWLSSQWGLQGHAHQEVPQCSKVLLLVRADTLVTHIKDTVLVQHVGDICEYDKLL